MKTKPKTKVAIIGGGASGLLCAIEISKKSDLFDVTVFEKNERVGKKILATGNGRCNLSNKNLFSEYYYDSADFVEKTLLKFDFEKTIENFETLGLFCKTDGEGRAYPLSNRATSVLDCLRFNCEKNGVKTKTETEVKSIKRKNDGFLVEGEFFDRLVLACGGKSRVKNYNANELAFSLGHSFEKTAPALVKLKTSSIVTKSLKGVRADVSLTLLRDGREVEKSKGELRLNEFSISGICAMRLSYYVAKNPKKSSVLRVDFAPEFENEDRLFSVLKNQRKSFSIFSSENFLTGIVHKKIGIEILKSCGISPSTQVLKLGENDIKNIAKKLKAFDFEITGTKDFSESRVMLGGVRLSEVDSKTLESKTVKNLFFCGEILDVVGRCGGYNLQWAWSSAMLVSKSITKDN